MSGSPFGTLFADETQFPRQRFFSDTVGSGAQVVASGAVRIHHYSFTAGSAGGTLILRGAGPLSGHTYERVKVLAGDTKVVPVGFYAASGLEVLTTTAGGDFSVTAWYL